MFTKISYHAQHIESGYTASFEPEPDATPAEIFAYFKKEGWQPTPNTSTVSQPAEKNAGDARLADSPEGADRFVVSGLVSNYDSDRGRWYFKVKGGNYGKFGVQIWDEVLKGAGIEPTNAPNLPDVAGWLAVVEMKGNGKPKKVISLQAPN